MMSFVPCPFMWRSFEVVVSISYIMLMLKARLVFAWEGLLSGLFSFHDFSSKVFKVVHMILFRSNTMLCGTDNIL